MCFGDPVTAATLIGAGTTSATVAAAPATFGFGAFNLGAISAGTALGAASFGLQGLSLLSNMAAQRAQAKFAQTQAAFQANVQKRNAELAERLAPDAIKRGEIEKKQLRLRA